MKQRMKLRLASTSPYRKALLEQAQIAFETCHPEVDESMIKKQISSPQKIAETLATKKAEAGKKRHPNDWIIGSDQVACLGEVLFDKPGTFENAKKTLHELQGQSHRLITSVCLISPDRHIVWSNVTELTMRSLTNTEIEDYLHIDEPFDCAGSYKLEKAGIRLFESIRSTDFTAIQGLPMIELCNHLYQMGFFAKDKSLDSQKR